MKKKKKIYSYDELVAYLTQLIKTMLDDNDKVNLTDNIPLEKIGFDSIRYIHLFMLLEEKLDIKLESIVSEINLTSATTIKDLAELLNNIKQ